jgi:hypothetical protein
MSDLYTASQAIQRLKVPRSTFYHLVARGDIPTVPVPLRKQVYYPKAQIDALAQRRQAIVREYHTTPERLTLMRPSTNDLEQLVAIDRTSRGDVGIIEPGTIAARFASNPDCVHVLKDTTTDQVFGGVTMSTMATKVIQGLITLAADESEIKPTDYLPFTPGVSQDCYIVGIVARQDIGATYYASMLLRHTMDYLVELVERGICFRTLYTVATTKDGERLARKLGFEELTRGQGPLGDERIALKLDMEQKQPKAPLVVRYQRAARNQTRRAKRYQKQASQARPSDANLDANSREHWRTQRNTTARQRSKKSASVHANEHV